MEAEVVREVDRLHLLANRGNELLAKHVLDIIHSLNENETLRLHKEQNKK